MSEIAVLFGASDAGRREAAWDDLIARHTRLLLAAARSYEPGHDEVMDRYAYILEKLREDDFRRLRTFNPNAGASFATWLTVAARRLCLDHHRSLYGRYRTSNPADESAALRAARRALVDSLGSELEMDLVPDESVLSPDALAEHRERNELLKGELAKLSAHERLLLTLRFQDGRSASQIAAFMGEKTPFGVYRELNRILARLRSGLEARGVGSADG